MMKRILAVCVLLCMVIVGCASVVADDTVTMAISYVPENSEITISGSAYGDAVILIVPDSLLPKDISESAVPTVFKQTFFNGNFSLDLGMPYSAGGGKYKVYVFIDDKNFEDTFIYMDLATSESLIPTLNVLDGEDFEETLLNNAQTLGIDTDDEVYIQKKEMIFEILDAQTYDSAPEFNKAYTKAYALSAIEGEESTEKIDSILMKHSKVLGIDYFADFDKDERLSDLNKKELLRIMSEIHYADEADSDGNIDFKNIFTQNKPLSVSRIAENWVEIKNMITKDFSEEFKKLTTNKKFVSIKDKDCVFEKMMDGKLNTLDEIENNFVSCVNKIYSSYNENTGSGGGKGSSGSGGDSSFGTVISVPENTLIQTEKKDTFSDVGTDHWASLAINRLVEDGIISGYGDGTFIPSKEITRAEFTKMAICFALEVPDGKTINFEDVSQDSWFYKPVSEAACKGIINGYGQMFYPQNLIKREDAALIVYRILCILGNEPRGLKAFSDRTDVSPYAEDAVYALGGAGIIQGNNENQFLPQNHITRAEAAQLLYNAFIK